MLYEPDTGFTGDDSFNFKANDGKADSNVATVSITVNPPPTVTGTVRLEAMVEPITGARVTFTGNPTLYRVTTDPADGSFQIQVPPGTYTVAFEKDSFLTAIMTGLAVEQNMVLPEVLLVGGDVNGDGIIDVHDLVVFAKNQGRVGSMASIPPPSGMVSWWSGDGHPNDINDGKPRHTNGGRGVRKRYGGEAFDFSSEKGSVVIAPSGPGLDYGDWQKQTIDFWLQWGGPKTTVQVGATSISPNPPMRSGLGVGTRGEGRGTRRSALDSDKWGRWRPLVGVGGADGGPGQRRWGGVGGTACKGRQSRSGPVRLCRVVE